MSAGLSVSRLETGAAAFVFALLLACQRTLITDFREREADQLIGRETVMVALGEKAAQRLYAAGAGMTAAVLVVPPLMGWTTGLSYLLTALVPFTAGVFTLLRYRALPEAELGEALVDSKFYLAGLLAALWLVA
jgi:4-hydroxybenzoate polyprenyltransferase